VLKVVLNLWAVRVVPEPCWGSLQRSPHSLAMHGEGTCCPFPQTKSPSRPFDPQFTAFFGPVILATLGLTWVHYLIKTTHPKYLAGYGPVLHIVDCELLVVGLMAGIGDNKGRKQKLTAAEVAALLEASQTQTLMTLNAAAARNNLAPADHSQGRECRV